MYDRFSTFSGDDIAILMFFVAIAFVPLIFFLLSLQNTLKTISPDNRYMKPGQVWLLCIPIFNLIWQFIVVSRVSDSIKLECERLNIPTRESRPTYRIGLAWCICSLSFFIPFLPFVTLIIWILYWVKINEHRKLILQNQGGFLLDAEMNVFSNDKGSV